VENTDTLCSTGPKLSAAAKRRRKQLRAKFLDRIRDSLGTIANQLAFTIPEAALLCGRSVTWGYRRVYAGEWRVTNQDGRLLVPRGELEHFLQAAEYSREPKTAEHGSVNSLGTL
jgi:hypothetical protein